jgi:hypothetical protein
VERLKKAIENAKKNEKRTFSKFEIIASDQDGGLEGLLNCIKDTGNIGHSFNIVVDPDNKEYRKEFGWDGDGADYIKEIKKTTIEEK